MVASSSNPCVAQGGWEDLRDALVTPLNEWKPGTSCRFERGLCT